MGAIGTLAVAYGSGLNDSGRRLRLGPNDSGRRLWLGVKRLMNGHYGASCFMTWAVINLTSSS